MAVLVLVPAKLSIYVEKVYQTVVAEKALLSFGVDAQHISQPLFGSNAVVKVASMHSEYALRLHRASRSPQRIDRDLAFVSALRQQEGRRLPCPVKTISGDYSCTVLQEGNEFRCSLLTWIKGEPRVPGHGFGVASARQAGGALGAIHRYSQSLTSPSSASSVAGMEGDFRLSRSVREGDDAIVTLLPELAPLIRALRQRLEVVLDAMPESGVIHGDFILKNLLCHRTLGIGVLDFDDSIMEYYVLDFAGMLENLDQVHNEGGLQTAFLEGYASAGHDVAAVHEYRCELIALRHYAGIAWAIGMLSEQRISKDYFDEVTQYRSAEIRRLLTV